MASPPTYALNSAATVFGVVTKGGGRRVCESHLHGSKMRNLERLFIYGGFWKIWWLWPVVISSRFER